MNASDYSTGNATLITWGWTESQTATTSIHAAPIQAAAKPALDLLKPVRRWLDGFAIQNEKLAHLLCKTIPTQCPFERDIKLFGRTILHIPPLCKLNPLYDEVVGLRFRALCYLADVCGVDVTPYC